MRKFLIFIILSLFVEFSYAQFSFKPYHPEVVIDDNSLSNPWAGGINAAQYNKLDLNNDGIEDLVIFDRGSNRIIPFLAQNNKWYYAPDFAVLFPEGLANWMLLVDYNCDGKKDIFTWAQAGMKVFKNVSEGENIKWEKVADPLNTEGFSRPVNLAVNLTDIPVITDIDGDGDVDILVFNFAAGDYVEYHLNLSIETTGTCGELMFRRVREPWGDFIECGCNSFGLGGPCEEPGEANEEKRNPENAKIMHAAGKAMLLLDTDGNGVKDLVLGMEDCEELYLLKNQGTNANALIRSFSNSFPEGANPPKFPVFPAAFYEDVDFDGKKDLMVSTNFALNPNGIIDMQNSSWFYKNTGENNKPDFQFITRNFLQEDMIDLGSNAVPAFADINGDGRIDLIVGRRGFNDGESFSSSMWLFENKGSATNPYFELKTRNYLDLQSLKLYNIKPQFADINGDGKPDLIFSASDYNLGFRTRIYYLLNKGNGGNFSVDLNELKLFNFDITVSEHFIVNDVDGDGKQDIIHGRSSGRVDFYKNTGTFHAPEFTLETGNFLGLSNNFLRGNPKFSIADFNNDGKEDLLISDFSGAINIYPSFKDHLKGTIQPEEEIFENEILKGKTHRVNLGNAVHTAAANLFFDDFPAIIAGTAEGGLVFLKNTAESDSKDFFLELKVFPNPASGYAKIRANDNVRVEIFNLLGQKLLETPLIEKGSIFSVNTATFASGVYIVRAYGSNKKTAVIKLIISK
jgi:hypothetical protein